MIVRNLLSPTVQKHFSQSLLSKLAIILRVLIMFPWRVVFLALALLSALFGFAEITSTFVGIARILCLIFVILFVVSFLVTPMRWPVT